MQVTYYTDPACPWSWALEPGLLRLMFEFDQSLRVTHVRCYMAPEFGELWALA